MVGFSREVGRPGWAWGWVRVEEDWWEVEGGEVEEGGVCEGMKVKESCA